MILLKVSMLLAGLGHVVCGYADCLLSHTTSGKIDLRDVNDPRKMNKMFADMPLKNPMRSMLLGTLALTICAFGYIGLCDWMAEFSVVASRIMCIGAILYLVPIVTHHVFFGAIEWFYVRLNRTDEVREAVLEFQKKTYVTMYVGYLGLLIFAVTFFIAVLMGGTGLPRWACIFNTFPLFIALLLTKVPAKGNVAGAIMFIGLLLLI